MRTNRRGGFTLVELMVSMALTLFIMVILSQAFVLSLETFSGMKGIGDMQHNLRVATTLLRDDLMQDHFEGRRRLSDMSVNGLPMIVEQPPQAGFFVVKQGFTAAAAAGVVEGNDTNGMQSSRATDHVLYMTVKRRGNRPENFFTASLSGGPNVLNPFFSAQTAYNVYASVPPSSPSHMPEVTMTTPYLGGANGFYSSQWAEVIYYLKRMGSTEEPNNPASTIGTPTFELYRGEFVMVPDGTNLKVTPFYPQTTSAGLDTLSLTAFKGMSCMPENVGLTTVAWQLMFYSPADAARQLRTTAPVQSPKRMLPSLLNFTPQSAGAVNRFVTRVLANEAPVLPNVLSFQVRVMATGANSLAFTDISPTGNFGRLYDTTMMTAPAATYNNKAGLKAVQITLRVWDNKTRQTRQVTIVQDM